VATLALPNKIIYLERETIHKLTALAGGRELLNLKDLLVLIFKTFSASSTNFALHYLRAYHLVDLLRRTTQEEIELVLLNSPEFIKSDKKKGIYHYHEIAPAVTEIAAEEAEAAYLSEEPSEVEGAAALPDEVEFVDEVGEMEIEFEQVAPPPALVPERPKPAPAAPPVPGPAAPALPPVGVKKEKPHKKKKGKVESEKTVRARKSERRVIEERIEDEETAEEALLAEKAAQEEDLDFIPEPIEAMEEEPEAEAAAETPAAEAVEEPAAEAAEAAAEAEAPAEPAKSAGPGGLFGNLFAEKLKSALVKKRAEDAQKKPEDETPES